MKLSLSLFCAACLSLAWAEDPLAIPDVIASVPTGWEETKAGTWVEIQSVVSGDVKFDGKSRQTQKVDVVGRRWVESLDLKAPGAKPTELEIPLSIVHRDSMDYVGEEDIQVGKATLRCKKWKPKRANPDPKSASCLWTNDAAKETGGIVRWETYLDGSYSSMTVFKLIELDREVDVCGRKVRCSVLLVQETRDGENDRTETEEVRSLEVPGLLVKRTATNKTSGSTGSRSVKSVQEVTAVHLEGEEWARK